MSFAKHSIQTIFVRIAILFILLLSGVITARYLGPVGEGVLSLLILLKMFAFRFGNIGVGSSLSFFVAQKRIQGYHAFQIAIGLALALGVISSIVMLGLWKSVVSPWHDISPRYFYAGLAMILLFYVNFHCNSILSGQLKITFINLSEMILNISYTIFLVLFVIIFGWGLWGGVFSMLLGDVLTCVFLVFAAWKHPVPVEEPKPSVTLSEFFKYGWWNYLMTCSNFLTEELPMMLLKIFSLNNLSVGIFYKARGAGRQSRNMAISIAQVLFPYTASSKEKSAIERTNILCRNSLCGMLFLLGGLSVVARPLILFLYGNAFSPAVPVFYALLPGFLVWPMGHFLGVHLAARGEPKRVFYSGIVTVAIIGIAGWLLISPYGPIGAALTASMSYLVQTAIRIWQYRQATGTRIPQICMVQKDDGKYYRQIWKTLHSFIQKK